MKLGKVSFLAVSSAAILHRGSAVGTIVAEPQSLIDDSYGSKVAALGRGGDSFDNDGSFKVHTFYAYQLCFYHVLVSTHFGKPLTSSFCISVKPEGDKDMLVRERADHRMLRRSVEQVEETTRKLDLISEGNPAGFSHRELQVTINGIEWRFGANAIWSSDCDFPNMGDYKQVYNTKGEQCDPLCRDESSCTHFAWSQGTCYLKNGGATYADAKKLTSGSGVVCGVRNIVWQESFTCSWAFDCDFPNRGDYKQVYNTKGEQCDPLCAGESSCTHFAWSKGTCYLKNGGASMFDAKKLTSGSGVVCGVRKPAGWQTSPFSKTIFQYNCDFPNMGDYKQVSNQPVLGCGPFCAKDSKCTHYTWSKGTCYLKTGGATTSDARTGTSYVGSFCAIKN
jgi:hypothetical protein